MSAGVNYREQQPDYGAVPPAVRKKAEEAERITKAIREGKDPMNPASYAQPAQTEEQTPQPAQDAPREPERKPEATQEPPKPDGRQETRQEPAKADVEKAEQRYSTLQGMYNALQTANRALQAENDGLRNAISELEARAPSNTPPAPTFDISKVLSEDERTEWGEDFSGILARVTEAATAPLLAEINKLKGNVEATQSREIKSARDKMNEQLDKDVPGWVELNTDPEFVTWLQNTDEASGQRRHTLLKDAYSANEGARVAHFFTRFLREIRGATPEAREQQGNGQGRASAPKSRDLTDFAAPGKGKTPVATTPSEGRSDVPSEFIGAEVTAFFTNKALGRLKKTPEQIAAYEAAINKAYSEGRIKNG